MPSRTSLALIVVASCSAGHADPPPAAAPVEVNEAPRQRFEENMLLRMHMSENFGVVRQVERELLANDLDRGRDLATVIASSMDEPGTEPWAKESALVRQRALAITRARTVEQALRADAELAAACAGCHVAAGAQPEFDRWPAEPRDETTVEARMLRHGWAADRLWEGVVGDAPESWRAGLSILAAAPLPTAKLGERAMPYAKQLQQLARDAQGRADTTDLAGRSATYGALLVTCAACHAATPSAPP